MGDGVGEVFAERANGGALEAGVGDPSVGPRFEEGVEDRRWGVRRKAGLDAEENAASIERGVVRSPFVEFVRESEVSLVSVVGDVE